MPLGGSVAALLLVPLCDAFGFLDSQLKSAVSDLEVDYIEFKDGPEKIMVPGYDRKVDFGMFWEWAYQVEGSGEEIVIATTRPETMFGDSAVAVHPGVVNLQTLSSYGSPLPSLCR